MANKDIFDFAQPSSDLTLWRYMDFAKYISMIINQGLYFSRGDLFEDTHEGSQTAKSLEQRDTWVKEHADWKGTLNKLEELNVSLPKTFIEQTNSFHTKLNLHSRKSVFVNCWHASDFESEAMWKLYGGIKSSIAIRTTYSKLDRSLPDDCRLGIVQYAHFEELSIPYGDLARPFMYKRKAFEHEKEVRCLIWDNDFFVSGPDAHQEKTGIFQKLSLENLISSIHVAPKAETWFFNLVRQTTTALGLEIEIKQSNLFSDPLF